MGWNHRTRDRSESWARNVVLGSGNLMNKDTSSATLVTSLGPRTCLIVNENREARRKGGNVDLVNLAE